MALPHLLPPLRSVLRSARSAQSLRDAAITLPQVHSPARAAAAIRALTSRASGAGAASARKTGAGAHLSGAVNYGVGVRIGEPGERYAPPVPNNGRTSGIALAQAAAALPPRS